MALAQEALSVSEWVALSGGTVTIISVLGGLLIKIGRVSQRSEDRFAELSKAVNEVKLECRGTATSVEELRRVDQQHEFKILDLTKESGDLKGQVGRLIALIERQSERKTKEENGVIDRLARIEERLGIFIDLFKQESR